MLLSIPCRGRAGAKVTLCPSLDAALRLVWDYVAEPEHKWKMGVSQMVT